MYIERYHFVMCMLDVHTKKKTCSMCSTVSETDTTEKIYTQKELVLLETYITTFYYKFCVMEIQKLAFHFPHVRILGNHQCDKKYCEAFKCQS